MIYNNYNKKRARSNIALDIGNVLVHIDLKEFYEELVNLSLCENKEQAEEFSESVQHVFDIGVYDLSQGLRLYFPKISKNEKLRLKEAWHDVVKPCKETLQVLLELISEGHSIALLSNIGIDHAKYLSEICSYEFNFCIKHFSCNVGARKPTKLYYQSFILENPSFSQINTVGLKYYRTLFLDDKYENIKGAKPYFDGKIFDISKHSSGTDAANEMIKIIQDI